MINQLVTKLTRYANPIINGIKQNSKVLLLIVGNDIEHRVHVIRRRRHRQARHAAVGGVCEGVLVGQSHIQAREPKLDQRRQILVGLHKARSLHLVSKLIPYCIVNRSHEPRYDRTGIYDGSGSLIRVECEIVGW